MMYPKRRGFASGKGEDYEVFLCCLFLLRALRLTSGDFFLASNHDLAGDFDDVLLFYRLKEDQGPGYRAMLLQAKHRERITKKKLTLSNPFSLRDYLKSFKEMWHHWERPLQVGDVQIQFQEIILVLYTNTGCVIGEPAAVDVSKFPEVRHLQELLDTGGRLLRISDGQRLGLPQGQETSDFLSHLVLCTEQTSVDAANGVLEEELRHILKVTSEEVARKLCAELKRVVKDWWREEGTTEARYLTAESEEWRKVLQVQVDRLNEETVTIDRQLDVEFEACDVAVPPPSRLRWISVRDEHQAKAVRSRLFRALTNSLVIGVRLVDDHWEEVEALWRGDICPTLVLDLSAVSPEEEAATSPVLQRLQEGVQQGGRSVVVIARGKPSAADGCWREVDVEPTWSVLRQVTRDRLLETPVRLQGAEAAVALRDVLGGLSNHHVMSDEVISSVCECKTEMKLGEAMPAPLEYNLPRCLQRTSSETVSVDKLANANTLICSSNFFVHERELLTRFHIVNNYDVDCITEIKHPTIIEWMRDEHDIRQLCCRFRFRGISGEISTAGLGGGDVKEFIPFTWMCKEKAVVIEGPPGVGKSSFVTAMCSSVKRHFPGAWVLRLDMGRHTEYIKETDLTEVSHVKEFLLKGLQKDPTSLERRLLEHSLSVTGNVFLFLDAFDEISPDFTSRCCDLLRSIAQVIRYRQMVVTTRPVTTKDVEEALRTTKAFTLPVFSEKEQGVFLKQFSAAKGKQFREDEIYVLLQCVGPVLEIPLLCRMAAEVLLNRGGEQLLLKLQDPWRRVQLYHVFVEQSVTERVAEKLDLDTSRPGLKTLLESNQRQHLRNLQGLAVRKLMLAAQRLPPLLVSRETPEEKLGLVVVNTGGAVDFEHQTFAEYFLGCWLASHWRDCPRRLLRDVLFQSGFRFVGATLSWSLFDGYPLHLAVAQGDLDAVRELLSPPGTRDRGGLSAREVCHIDAWELLLTSGLNRKDDVLGSTAVEYSEFVDPVVEMGANICDLRVDTVEDEAVRDHLSPAAATGGATTKDRGGRSALHVAAMTQGVFHPREVWELLMATTDLNLKDDVLGATALEYAAEMNGNWNFVELALEKGADVVAADLKCVAAEEAAKEVLAYAVTSDLFHLTQLICGRHPPDTFQNLHLLHSAAGYNSSRVMELLMGKLHDLDAFNQYQQTPLHEASRRGHVEAVKLLVEGGARVDVEGRRGYTALTAAAAGGRLEVVKILLEKGAEVGKTTALTAAAAGGHLEVVKVLLEEGDLDGKTALTAAAAGGRLEVVNMLLEKRAEDGRRALKSAAYGGHLDVVKLLLEKASVLTADVNRALTMAATRGHLEVVKVLVEAGAADLNAKYMSPETALTGAARAGHLEVVKTLLQKGADVNMRNAFGGTALMEAAARGDVDMARMLLEEGADLNMKKLMGETALTEAAAGGHLEVVEAVLEKGAKLKVKAVNGGRALTEAARGGHLEVVQTLLDRGADLGTRPEDVDKALMKAAGGGHLQVVKLLLHNGADANARNFNGETALMLADREHHMDVFKFLSLMPLGDV